MPSPELRTSFLYIDGHGYEIHADAANAEKLEAIIKNGKHTEFTVVVRDARGEVAHQDRLFVNGATLRVAFISDVPVRPISFV